MKRNLTPRICIYCKTSTWKSLVNPWRASSTLCWSDRITNVRKLDNIVWSDASWDIWNSPFVSFWFWLKTARNVTKTTFLALFSPFSCLLPHGQVSALFCALIKSQSGPCREPWKKETFCKTRAILLYNVPFLIKCMSTSTIEPNQTKWKFHCVRLPSLIELYRLIKLEWIRWSSIKKTFDLVRVVTPWDNHSAWT